MNSRCTGRYRFSWTAFLSLLAATPVFAGDDWGTTTAPLSTSIISAGFAAFALLALFVLALTALFLLKALKESAAAKKEAAAHSSSKSAGSFSLTVGLWLSSFFVLAATGSIFTVGLFLLADADLSPTLNIGSTLITAGLIGFALLVLYLVFLAVLSLFKKPEGAARAAKAVPVDVSLAGLPLNPEITRRSFLSLLGWAWVAFTAATMGALSTLLRFAFPNVTFEPPLKFKAGFPDTYSMGVDERNKDAHRVWIVRNQQGFYALSTICTHLGCTPNWLSAEQKFKCPCHGSGFYITGVNFEGPAPRPLERFKITLADDGQIEVDESQKFQQELGQWGLPGSFLEYTA